MRDNIAMQKGLWEIYHPSFPEFLSPFLSSPELVRLKGVGMNCGVEYTSIPFLKSLPKSDRFSHSVGVALIAYHFSASKKAALAGLFHDIASPCFSHTVDFLYGDHAKQEATEERTTSIISSSPSIMKELKELGIALDEVNEYSCYPICDNPTPHLSADRLEYTLRNILLFGYGDKNDLIRYYADLKVGRNEMGEEELVFSHADVAKDFGKKAIGTFRIYVSKEDRYAMELLSLSLAKAIKEGLLDMEDLYLDEPTLLAKLNFSEEGRHIYERFHSLVSVEEDPNGAPVVSKVRYIDPLIEGSGRLSKIDPFYEREIASLRQTDFSVYLSGRFE